MGQLVRHPKWAYIAGFFDGDGNIDIQLRSSTVIVVRTNWFQSEPSSLVLKNIARFLDDEYFIKSYWHRMKTGKNFDGTYEDIINLRVNAKDDVRLILESMMPYLIVKAEEAWKALRLIGTNYSIKPYPVSWDYLAGFTDSDGHISTRVDRRNKKNYTYYTVGWSQLENNSYVLDEILEFLKDEGISCSDSETSSGERQITASQAFTEKILDEMLPWLTVKGRKARIVLNSYNKEKRQSKVLATS